MTTDPHQDPDLVVRLPRQQRSREAWTRILDAGVAIIEEGGYDAFTIAAVCARAAVAPRALYERVNTKDGLFLAVYEYKLSQVVADQNLVFEDVDWGGLAAEELIARVVDGLIRVFTPHRAFLRSVILISGVHPEINRRGGYYARSLGDQFTSVLMHAEHDIEHADPEAAVRMSFTSAFSALVLRTSYGPEFFGPAIEDDIFGAQMSDMIERYLLRPGV